MPLVMEKERIVDDVNPQAPAAPVMSSIHQLEPMPDVVVDKLLQPPEVLIIEPKGENKAVDYASFRFCLTIKKTIGFLFGLTGLFAKHVSGPIDDDPVTQWFNIAQ